MRLIVLSALLLTACVSASEVVPVGENLYLVTARASGGLNAGKETTSAMTKANAFCGQSKKKMTLDHIDKTGNAAVFGENVSVYFRCD